MASENLPSPLSLYTWGERVKNIPELLVSRCWSHYGWLKETEVDSGGCSIHVDGFSGLGDVTDEVKQCRVRRDGRCRKGGLARAW